MLLARKMVANYLPQYVKYLEPQDSYYIGTDIFYSYIVENKLWKLRIYSVMTSIILKRRKN